MKDLEKASKIDNEDKIIKDEINRVNDEIKRLKALEKKNNFSGIFNKPNNNINTTSNEKKDCKIVSEEKEKKIEPPINKQTQQDPKNANMNYKLSYEVDPNAKVPDEISELGKYLFFYSFFWFLRKTQFIIFLTKQFFELQRTSNSEII